jgi:hypothetical protein
MSINCEKAIEFAFYFKRYWRYTTQISNTRPVLHNSEFKINRQFLDPMKYISLPYQNKSFPYSMDYALYSSVNLYTESLTHCQYMFCTSEKRLPMARC